jgi:glycosyltransferase involved in cell wall biosynthesis
VQLALAGPTVSGDYLKSLWDLAERLGVRQQVEYHGILSKEDALLFQRRADIGLVIYQPLLYCINSLPNKLVECMSLGLPVVFSNFPNYREIAEKSGAGIMVDPTKPEQIADAIELLVRDPDSARRMGEAGSAAVRDRFNWQVESIKLLDLYRQLIGTPQKKAPFN